MKGKSSLSGWWMVYVSVFAWEKWFGVLKVKEYRKELLEEERWEKKEPTLLVTSPVPESGTSGRWVQT